MLDELGALHAGDHYRRAFHWLVDAAHQFLGLLGGDAHHYAVGLQEVPDGGAFAQELRVGGHVEGEVVLVVALHGLDDPVAGGHGDGGLLHDHRVVGHVLRHFLGNLFYSGQVGRTVLAGRGAHGYEHGFGAVAAVVHAVLYRICEVQAPGFHVLLDDALQVILVDGHDPFLEQLDLGGVVVHADHAVADLGQAGPADQAYVARAHYANIHFLVLGLFHEILRCFNFALWPRPSL